MLFSNDCMNTKDEILFSVTHISSIKSEISHTVPYFYCMFKNNTQ